MAVMFLRKGVLRLFHSSNKGGFLPLPEKVSTIIFSPPERIKKA